MKKDLLKYIDKETIEGQDLEFRLQLLFQKKKFSDFGISDEEIEQVKDPDNEQIPAVIKYIAGVIEDMYDQMQSYEQEKAEKLKCLFLILNQSEERFKKHHPDYDDELFNFQSSDEEDKESDGGDKKHERDIDAQLLNLL